jgi:hypothetical protein
MAGPIQAMIPSGGERMLASVCSRIPAASPRQPACATDTSSPSIEQKKTGRQSAVSTPMTSPGVLVVAASASGSICSAGGASTRATRVPWT